MTKAKEKPTVTPNQAKQVLQEEEQARMQEFGQLIESHGQRLGLSLAAMPRLVPDGTGRWVIVADIQVVPRRTQ